MTSYFYLHAEKDSKNAKFLDDLEHYANENKCLTYILDRPLIDSKYKYAYPEALIVLSPKHKIAIINFGSKSLEFDDFVEDVIEDIGSISDKFLYKDAIGRPRQWRNSLVSKFIYQTEIAGIPTFLQSIKLTDSMEIKKQDLLISLFIGSINDIDRVKMTVPQTPLEKIKQKIQLFDGDQTRFIYTKSDKKKRVVIQGLSGTGKTELLLHKLKDIYTEDNKSKIFFTCHNKILADNLRKRIPTFFNFMKVEQQIEWESRLWCAHAWGAGSNPNSGVYSYICAFYRIPFLRYTSYRNTFEEVCRIAISEIKSRCENKTFQYAFTHMFVDESQDFGENFLELCDLVTKTNLFIAGDIFQSIFDVKIIRNIEPDFLLGKCYRTDPRTLMFAHALGMGLFEEQKLRWLEKKEWEGCGYSVEIEENNYLLSREPLRRFEDLDHGFKSIEIVETSDEFSAIIQILLSIKEENESVLPEDVGIILIDENTDVYFIADTLELLIQDELNWEVNKAYETKEIVKDTILISNRNNVKGLEFPFVICVTNSIKNDLPYRNALYTMLTRSFLKSFLVISSSSQYSGFTQEMRDGLEDIMVNNRMIVGQPSEEAKRDIRTRFELQSTQKSFYETMMDVFKILDVDKEHHEQLIRASKELPLSDHNFDTLKKWTADTLKYIKK